MARRPALNKVEERQLELLVEAGVTQAIAARALGVSRSTAQRSLARLRAEREPETLDDLLAALPTIDEMLAALPPRLPVRQRQHGSSTAWRESARALEQMAPERWGRADAREVGAARHRARDPKT
jgi:hypothetical protein